MNRPDIRMRPYDADDYQLTAPYSWRGVTIPVLSRNDSCGNRVHLGFKTDLGSVPKVVPPILIDYADPDYLAAFVNHDFRYSFPDKSMRQHKGNRRRLADTLLREDLIALGVSKRRAGLVYRAVRIGGWIPWLKSSIMGWHNNVDYHYAPIPERVQNQDEDTELDPITLDPIPA